MRTTRFLILTTMAVTFFLLGCGGPSKVSSASKIVLTNSVGMEFVKIPAGTFEMGSEKSGVAMPVHKVTLDSFLMCTTEVTNGQFSLFKALKRPSYSLEDDMPVMNVSREEIDQYIEWLSKKDGRRYSLPTEAQWEFAARSGIKNADYPWGKSFDSWRTNIGTDFGNLQAKKVKQYPPNAYGLYDICGNASEEVYECDYEYSSKALRNPRGVPPTKKDQLSIVRGTGIEYYNPQVWYRRFRDPASKDRSVGFRLVVQDKSS